MPSTAPSLDPTVPWVLERQAGRVVRGGWLALVAGVGIATASLVSPAKTGDSWAGPLFALLLCVAGLAMLTMGAGQRVMVDPRARTIEVYDRRRFFPPRRVLIRFADIRSVEVEDHADADGQEVTYHLVLRLSSGEIWQLFMGFYEGDHSRSVVEQRQQRLQALLNPPSAPA